MPNINPECFGSHPGPQQQAENSCDDCGVKGQCFSMPIPSGGVKHDEEKVCMDLLCPHAIEELAKVLTFGKKKYSAWNWSKGIKTSRLIAAALRHTFAYARGEDTDPETGLHHMAHAMCCCMFIIGMPHYVTGQDDRV